MSEYELLLHLRELDFRETGNIFAGIEDLTTKPECGLCSPHPVYISYTLCITDDDDDFFAKEKIHELHEFISNLDPKNYALVALES